MCRSAMHARRSLRVPKQRSKPTAPTLSVPLRQRHGLMQPLLLWQMTQQVVRRLCRERGGRYAALCAPLRLAMHDAAAAWRQGQDASMFQKQAVQRRGGPARSGLAAVLSRPAATSAHGRQLRIHLFLPDRSRIEFNVSAAFVLW